MQLVNIVRKAGRFIQSHFRRFKGVTIPGSAEGKLLYLGGSVQHIWTWRKYSYQHRK